MITMIIICCSSHKRQDVGSTAACIVNTKLTKVSNYSVIINTKKLHFQAIQSRFADVLGNKDKLLGAVSCPKFKL